MSMKSAMYHPENEGELIYLKRMHELKEVSKDVYMLKNESKKSREFFNHFKK